MKKQRLVEGDSAYRKAFPLAEGCLDYFPDALAAVSNLRLSRQSQAQQKTNRCATHGPSSTDHAADCIMRHLTERGGFDASSRLMGWITASATAWRWRGDALALAQQEIEEAGRVCRCQGEHGYDDAHRPRSPFTGKDVQGQQPADGSTARGKYACGPVMENGEPESSAGVMHEVPPIQIEAAAHIQEALEASLAEMEGTGHSMGEGQRTGAGQMRIARIANATRVIGKSQGYTRPAAP